uniref:Uncharacterized protein n=1 Tax=Lates calcarifer TaxID=8187 RepID=A0A4W6C187_LATCA
MCVSTCSGLRPVKQNIPIWSITCCQLWVEPSFFRPATSCSLILMMRLAIPWTSSSLSERRSDSTLFASSASLHTTVKPPTRSPVNINMPMFLAKDWDNQASRSISPLAKP